MLDYWKEALAAAADESDVALTELQLVAMAKVLDGAHENYRDATGLSVADRNWRAAEDKRLVAKGAETVLRHVENCVSVIDHGPARVFDAMSHEQRIAMHELFQARGFTRILVARAAST